MVLLASTLKRDYLVLKKIDMLQLSKQVMFVSFMILFVSCTQEKDDEIVEGLRPIYGNFSDIEVKSSTPQPYENLGQIVYRSPFIFINESSKGVHLIDITNPELPQKVAFIEIPGINSFNLKENNIYARSGSALLVVDISNFENAELLSATSLFENSEDIYYPENYQGAFECFDPSGGILLGWEEALLTNPKCRR